MRPRSFIAFLIVLTVGVPALAQAPNQPAPKTSPEMSRLAKMFVGDWDTVETMEPSEFFPNGGGRQGTTHWKLAVSGTTLIGEGHSNGSAGELTYLVAIWWDKPASVYRFFTCFNDVATPCTVRGTARWDGDRFINDYEEAVGGEKRKCHDIFTTTGPNSRSLVAAIEMKDGKLKPLITTKSTRH
jgi:hypothetical protein